MRLRTTLFTFVLALVALDQISKYAVENSLPFQQAVNVISYFSLFRTYNTGIAFSWLNWAGNTGLIVLAMVVLALVLYLWSKVRDDKQLAHIGFALIVGGAIGNLLDRLYQGHVIDFLLLHTQTWAFAVFNLADAFITMGAVAIVIDELFSIGGDKEQTADGPGQ